MLLPQINQVFPAHGGSALDGEIVTDDEILDMDRRILWQVIRKNRVTLPHYLPAFIGHSRPVGISLS